jgi:voltage-gated sodium channel
VKESIRSFVECKAFRATIFLLILLNTISLGLETFLLHDPLNRALDIFNSICTLIFVLEILLKLFAYGRTFFKDGWNIFDTVIVMISILPIVKVLSVMRLFRVFRVFRALRMMKQLNKLHVIVQALIGALPSVGWVVVLLIIIYYVFAVIGTNLFSELSPGYFGTLWESLFTLLQLTLADDLGVITRELLRNGIGAVIYFVSFVVITTILMLNVIVGIVVDSVSEIKNAQQKKEQMRELLEEYDFAENQDETGRRANDILRKEIQDLEEQLSRVKLLLDLEEQRRSQHTQNHDHRHK